MYDLVLVNEMVLSWRNKENKLGLTFHSYNYIINCKLQRIKNEHIWKMYSIKCSYINCINNEFKETIKILSIFLVDWKHVSFNLIPLFQQRSLHSNILHSVIYKENFENIDTLMYSFYKVLNTKNELFQILV